MRVALGSGALSDAWLQALQIVHLQAAFWLTLGVAMAVYDSATSGGGAFAGTGGSHVTLDFFFGRVGDAASAYLVVAHVLQGAGFGVVVGWTLERRALCPDAVGTAAILHVVASWLKAGFPTHGIYWVSLLLASGISLAVGNWLAGRRELAEIALPPLDAEPSRPRGSSYPV